MENNNLENDVVNSVPSSVPNNINNEQNNFSNNNDKKNSNKNLKKIAIFLLVFSIILITLGFALSFGVDAIKDNKDDKNKELARTIFEETEMDEYLKEVFIPGVQLNANLLDSNIKFMTDIYNNNSVPKYLFMYNEDDDASWIFIKYEDYAREYKNAYNKELSFSMIDTEMAFSNLVHIEDNKYLYSIVDGVPCTKSNIDKCYVNITKQIVSERDVKYESFDLKENNIVVGTAILTYNNNNTKSVLNGKFELKFKEENNKYVVDYIKIISIDEKVLARFDS